VALSYSLDVRAGLAFKAGLDRAVGYLTGANFFSTTFSADLAGTNPLTGASLPAVAVLSSVQWAETVSASLSLRGCLSARNWALLTAMTETTLTSTGLTLSFTVYAYDPVRRVYFSAFAPQQPPLHALLAMSGMSPELTIAAEPLQVGSHEVYEFHLSAVPPPNQLQAFSVAANPTAAAAQPWVSDHVIQRAW
jgi:hypothetical protein